MTVPDFDAAVVGGGIGGIYAVHRFFERGLRVVGFESADGVGGVWRHNRYPGCRVDVESEYYCYFDPELYPSWQWTERYSPQPELLAYLEFAADRYGVRPHFRFNTPVTSATWNPSRNWYEIGTGAGDTVTARFLVMAVGQLSDARRPPFAGLAEFAGRWVASSHWPEDEVELAGRRIGVIGTGSSGVQTVTAVAPVAEHLYVFQRTANYSVPDHNGPLDVRGWAGYGADVLGLSQRMLSSPTGSGLPVAEVAARDLSPAERTRWLEERWAQGGHAMNLVFTDQGTDWESNGYVCEFVREKVRVAVRDPATAEALLPTSYPIGTRRLIVDTGYYETFNRDNVTLVDIRSDPIERITRTGIQTRDHHYELDVIVFALGFNAFTGSFDKANIRDGNGRTPTDNWRHGPRTYLGMMTTGFPNLFNLTGPGSPSVLANMVLGNVHQVDFVGDLVAHMGEHGYTRVEPTEAAQDAWTRHVADLSGTLLRRVVENYMVHVNADGSRVFIPYIGGLGRYVETCREVADDRYRGFAFA